MFRKRYHPLISLIMYAGIIGAAFLVATSSEAAPGIASLTATPSAAFLNVPTAITFQVDIPRKPRIVRSSPTLWRFVGSTWINVGQMFDDGTHGDSVPGDNTFTTQITLNESQPQLASFRTSVAYVNYLKPGFSDLASVSVQPAPAEFVPGIFTSIATQSVGPAGGQIVIGNSGTPLDGTKVTFPSGALTQNVQVSVGYMSGTLVPNSGTFSGKTLVLSVPNVSSFEQPVSITAPLQPGAVPVPYFVNGAGQLRPAQLSEVDLTAGSFTFQTFHASLFTWLWESLFGGEDVYDTNYKPGDDGFKIVNQGSAYNRNGECFGMTSFSLWYFMNHRSTRGPFYPKYYDIIGNDSVGNPIRGQNVIATRAFISIAQQWNTYYRPIAERQQGLSQGARYLSIRNILVNTGNPVLLYLFHTSNAGSASHSVLAYAINNTSKAISIYDPNFPNSSKKIEFDDSTQAFRPYSGYDGIIYNGDGSLSLTEPYDNILTDADANFQNSGGSTITVTSHQTGQNVATRTITLNGTIESGQVLVSKLKVFVNSTEFTAAVPLNGSFGIPLNLDEGINHLRFVTQGNNAEGRLIDLTNNYETRDFTLNAVVPTSVILMTLTWNTNGTDVDTYVIDPTGDFSAYYHRTTADGGTLDRDITSGFGPEHWTLLNTNVVRYGQPYRFRVHYYSDHGHGPSNYTVTIKVYEGTPREETFAYSGSLTVSNPNNDQPNDVGPDWADVATIVLVPATESNPDSVGSVTRSAKGDRIVIRVPIPDPEQRLNLKVKSEVKATPGKWR